ncbi:hypothetical protein PYCCODRAFT_1342865, partial [Trametes coccinea BRFM310]
RMERFPCSGWLHLTVSDVSEIAIISVKHKCDHVAYLNIDLPNHWKAYIEEHARTQTPGQVSPSLAVVEKQIDVPFRSKAVYYYWGTVCRREWRLSDTPLASARKFLEERGEEFNVRALDIKEEPGTEVVAFYVKDFVNEWARNTQELGLDSTWNTNGGNFELFAAVADADGAGIPLAFLFISTSKGTDSGAKQIVLERFLGELKLLGVNPEFTLSDKDWSEINAMQATWTTAKHQLCFWHALRAVKQRLSKNKATPAPYDPEEAHHNFSFIDPQFVPLAQQKHTDATASGPPPKRPDYQFCPAAHRLPILRLFAKHASQHPLLPERHGQARTAEDIYRDAVSEMYHHCFANNLREAWAYLWNSWYRRPRWNLWARSAYSASIPCKRTTMMVEALWRNLKRLVLHMYNRPPVDLALYALITQALP